MSHSDDDGLVLPPKLAPKHVVLLPIYRSDDDKAAVRPFCDALKKDLEAIDFAGEKVRVFIDDRDMRGGEKNWYHVKRGVPIRVEVGPKDIAKNAVFMARRDTGAKVSLGRDEFVSSVASLLNEIQNGLFQRGLKLREENTRKIDSLDEFNAYFTSKNEDKPEIHGGFAMCHFTDTPAVDAYLKERKITIRCIPMDGEEEPGKCIVTGAPSNKRAVFAKAY